MLNYRRWLAGCVAGAAIAVMLLGVSEQAEARLLGRNAKAPEAPEVVVPLAMSNVSFSTSLNLEPSCCMPAPKCCPTPCISYRHCGLRKVKCCGCEPPVSTVLTVNNPCTCCPVSIPVCLPACCTGCPTVNCRHGLLADGVVTYDWCCGVSVTVRFKHCGDVLVTYRGV